MAVTKTYVGLNPDGTPHFLYESDGHVLITGPIYGTVQTEDGTTYDVSDQVIEIDPAHAGDLAHKIGVYHEEHGHPAHAADNPFVHDCTEHCGALARKADK
jgi:hypothetical protein